MEINKNKLIAYIVLSIAVLLACSFLMYNYGFQDGIGQCSASYETYMAKNCWCNMFNFAG